MKTCDARIAHVIGKPAIDSLYLNLFIVTADLYQRGVKCWAMLAVDTLANYSSAVQKRRGLLLLDFPTEALLRGLFHPHHRTDASVYPCGWMAERGVDFIMESLSRLPMHLPQWLAVHLPQWRGPRHGDLGGLAFYILPPAVNSWGRW